MKTLQEIKQDHNVFEDNNNSIGDVMNRKDGLGCVRVCEEVRVLGLGLGLGRVKVLGCWWIGLGIGYRLPKIHPQGGTVYGTVRYTVRYGIRYGILYGTPTFQGLRFMSASASKKATSASNGYMSRTCSGNQWHQKMVTEGRYVTSYGNVI
jgi:hypothetical protein